MSFAAVQELVAKQALDREVLSQFIDFERGEVTLRFESEYWDYKRTLPDLDDSKELAELAADVLAFHNSRGGYLVFGITNDFSVLGIHENEGTKIDSNFINSKLKRYIGNTFLCRYSCIPAAIGGSRKSIALLLIPRRKGIAIKAGTKCTLFKEGEMFLRSNDTRKRAVSDSDFLELFSPPEPEVIVGSHQLRTFSPRPGIRLFLGDYASTGFVGEQTRQPIVLRTLDELSFGKWDIILLRGVGGVGKTAVATEITTKLANEAPWSEVFGGIISLSGKSEQLTPFDRSAITPEITSFENFLRQIVLNSEFEGDLPGNTEDLEKVARGEIVDKRILLFIDNFETIETRDSRISTFLCNLPQGCKTLITSRHIPQDLPALPIEVPPLSRGEAETLARAEAAAQHLEALVNANLGQIIDISGQVPLAIKWIISCSKNAAHLAQLIEDHRKGKPTLANLCEFCFTFEYNLLGDVARRCLVALPIFRIAPIERELAVVTECETDSVTSALEELVNFSLVIREYSPSRGDNVYRLLKLTESFAEARLRTFGDFERNARRRLKELNGTSIAVLLGSVREMLERGVSPAATRKYIDEEILEREPDCSEGIFLRGRAFETEMSYSSAIKDYHRVIGIPQANRSVMAEAALGLVRLVPNDTQSSREELVPWLERAYQASSDCALAIEIAENLEILGHASKAQQYYDKVYRDSSCVGSPVWERAFVAVCQGISKTKSPKVALDFCQEALKMAPSSRVVRNHEKKFMEESGKLHYKRSRI
ncbi:MAG: RNA-binding domain-containing protein [Terracidiphilus sp.]